MMWIVMDIGCLECNVPTSVVGVFTNEERAKKTARILDRKSGSDQSFKVFPMPAIDVIGAEYAAQAESE